MKNGKNKKATRKEVFGTTKFVAPTILTNSTRKNHKIDGYIDVVPNEVWTSQIDEYFN